MNLHRLCHNQKSFLCRKKFGTITRHGDVSEKVGIHRLKTKLCFQEQLLQSQEIIQTHTWDDDTKSWSTTSLHPQSKMESNAISQIPMKQSYLSFNADLWSSSLYPYMLCHFLPAKYPSSVAPGYGQYASFSWGASVAGSASMVLSTQTLLLAMMGVEGGVEAGGGDVSSATTQAGILAGAFNWVLKDGIGQLGGILFASYYTNQKNTKVSSSSSSFTSSHWQNVPTFDASPKYWRMVAALALDVSNGLELLTPYVSNSYVVPLAALAVTGKNIGFLTASASRAALHQSLAISHNLADVTAKAGSQSIAASLVGTTIGLALSSSFDNVSQFGLGFISLCLVHQTCNFLSLKSVPLYNLDRHRLHILMEAFFRENQITLSPIQVASRESFVPFVCPPSSDNAWLIIGSKVSDLGGPNVVRDFLMENEKSYILVMKTEQIHLTFFSNASTRDVWKGIFHAYSLEHKCFQDMDNLSSRFQEFWSEMKAKDWNLEHINIEPNNAIRLRIV
jgi:Vitamin B6 photo-protection and homoeostasis